MIDITHKELEELNAIEISGIEFVKVVHCRDCEFYKADEKWCTRLGLCGAFDGEGFCSHGERRNE